MNTRKKTVYVGLSGGVDSAVSAYLLKNQGFRVVGVFIKGWEPDFLACTNTDDRLQAMRVAAALEIPFRTYDLSKEYRTHVVDYLLAEYHAGRTPNPDVVCNRAIKFGACWERAKKDGADFFATGHYAQRRAEGDQWALYRGVDTTKDQSYFLWTLTQDDLAHTLFPIGDMLKTRVRALARRARLPNAARKDSQGLCFLGQVDMHDFLKRFLPTESGIVRDDTGREVGVHDGHWFYTLGQRHGFTTHAPQRLYVVAKDIHKNELIVSEKQTPTAASGQTVIPIHQINWIRHTPNPDELLDVQVRYHGERYPAHIEGSTVRFSIPPFPAPGQSLVVYHPQSDECLGGGIIGEL